MVFTHKSPRARSLGLLSTARCRWLGTACIQKGCTPMNLITILHETLPRANTTQTALTPLGTASLCRHCSFPGPHAVGPGSGPHYQRLLCGQCGRFLQWLPKPKSGGHL